MKGLHRALALPAGVLVLSLANLSTAPAAPQAERSRLPEKPPVVLFWTDKAQMVPDATHLTPVIHLSSARSGDPLSQARLLARGVEPLAWCPGELLANESDSDILAAWSRVIQAGFVAIGMDELGGLNHAENRRFASLLDAFRREWPSVYIAVWNAGPIDPALARAYRTSVDLVMVEAYGPWGLHQFERFAVRLIELRLFGIVHKSIFGIGINDESSAQTLRKEGRWADDPGDLEAQIRWIAKNARDMAGIGFFANSASDHMLRVADELSRRYFLESR